MRLAFLLGIIPRANPFCTSIWQLLHLKQKSWGGAKIEQRMLKLGLPHKIGGNAYKSLANGDHTFYNYIPQSAVIHHSYC